MVILVFIFFTCVTHNAVISRPKAGAELFAIKLAQPIANNVEKL